MTRNVLGGSGERLFASGELGACAWRDVELVRGPANIKGIMSMARRVVAVLGAYIRFHCSLDITCTWLALTVYLTKHHKHCQIQIWTSIEKAKRATCTGNAGISATCCRLRAGLMHASCCMLHTACCRLFAAGCMPFVFNSQCCNSGRQVTYASCFLYLASVARRMLRAAYCVQQ